MAGIKEMRDELLGLLYEQLGFLDRSDHLTMPAYTSPGFPVNYLFYLGFSAPLRWREAERVDAAWLAMQSRIRRANARSQYTHTTRPQLNTQPVTKEGTSG